MGRLGKCQFVRITEEGNTLLFLLLATVSLVPFETVAMKAICGLRL